MEERSFKDVKNYSIVVFDVMKENTEVFYLVDKKGVAIYEYGANCKPKDITKHCYKKYKDWKNGCNDPKIGYLLFCLAVSEDSQLQSLTVLKESDNPKEITGKLHELRLEQARTTVRILERFGPNHFSDERHYGDKVNFMHC